ncbi:hypothetical protein CVU37_07815 [candidate division BRC1 bacterium HGW-BRC1-1]|jgi:hypothetical protein|nr:MAG: hypothetical protein CVU37_07815 [candidate division BRC1 bacterium HGW-BRC1-1]
MTGKRQFGECTGWVLFLALSVLLITGCGKSPTPDAKNPDKDSSASSANKGNPKTFISAHEAPHEGALTPLDKMHTAHVELLAEETSGILTLFVLDKYARDAVRVQQPTILLELALEAGDTSLTLQAKESFLSGETAGDASQFEIRTPQLVGVKEFKGVLDKLTIDDVVFEKIPLSYPDGTETSSTVVDPAKP